MAYIDYISNAAQSQSDAVGQQISNSLDSKLSDYLQQKNR